jgi:elongator complex protein 3
MSNPTKTAKVNDIEDYLSEATFIRNDHILTNIVKGLAKSVTDEKSYEMEYRRLRKIFSAIYRKSVLSEEYQYLTEKGIIQRNINLENMIRTKAARSHSGIISLTSVMKPDNFTCAENCAFCPDESKKNGAPNDMPRSYGSTEPSLLRAMQVGFDAAKQVWIRLYRLKKNGHRIAKIENIVLGGTFSHFLKTDQLEHITGLYYGANTFDDFIKAMEEAPIGTIPRDIIIGTNTRPQKTLEEEIKINETAKYGVIGLVPESRPDTIVRIYGKMKSHIRKAIALEMSEWKLGVPLVVIPDLLKKMRVNEEEMRRWRSYGVTRAQMGIQHIRSDILDLNNRGHHVDASIGALKAFLDNGFKVDGHLMPDMPGATPEIDMKLVDFVYGTPYLRLDYIKWYPCLDLPYTDIRKWKKNGTWKPYAESNKAENLIQVLLHVMRQVPRYQRINRIQRDFPKANTSDVNDTGKNKIFMGFLSDHMEGNLRQIVTNRLHAEGDYCKCIRCREVGTKTTDKSKAIIAVNKYEASDGMNYHISVINPEEDVLYGIIRLRFPSKTNNYTIFEELKGCALIRELHVYGQVCEVGSSTDGDVQHYGFGKKLMRVATAIAYKNGYRKISVISGVGVREYYRKLGYILHPGSGQYMIRIIDEQVMENVPNYIDINKVVFGKTKNEVLKKNYGLKWLIPIILVVIAYIINFLLT